MSYTTISQSANDPEFEARIEAAAADEGRTDPFSEAQRLRWIVAVADDIAAAYESAVLAGNEHPGSDPAVITDAMILSVVQANPAP